MDELLALEEQGWASLCDGTAADFYGTTMTHDGLMVLANGQVITRDEVVAALRDAPRWAGFEIADVRSVIIGSDAGAIVYTGTGQREDGPPFVCAMSSVYVRQAGRWRLALYQQTARA